MRLLLAVGILIAVLVAGDTIAFDGRYRKIVWKEATYQAARITYQVRYFLRKTGLSE
jgi:hypothetical protein